MHLFFWIQTISDPFTGDNKFQIAIISDPRCPADHPYAYKNGKQCCKTTQEFTNGRGASKAEKESGTCDGIGFNRDSTCCKDYERVPCPQKNECFNHDDIGMRDL